MSDGERQVLHALARMVQLYLADIPRSPDGLLDSHSMGPGEEAIEVLAAYGLVSIEPGQARFGKWTQAGHELLDSD